MKLSEIYHTHHIPPGLQHHMLTTAAVGKYVIDHWQGPVIDSQSVLAALLVHDLGNLVKFDLSDQATIIEPELHTDQWRTIQIEMQQKYGTNSHDATLKMIQEIGLPQKIEQLAFKMDASDVCKITKDSLEQQICQYADMRVTPDGVVPMAVRLADLRNRYSHHAGWDNEESYQANVGCAQHIEDTLQQHTNTDITAISPEKIEAYLVELAQFEIPTS